MEYVVLLTLRLFLYVKYEEKYSVGLTCVESCLAAENSRHINPTASCIGDKIYVFKQVVPFASLFMLLP